MRKMHEHDIIIIGAGFSGLTLAHALAGQGLQTAIVEKRTSCPDIFRAEKIEPDQAELMREFGTLDLRSPKRKPIGKTINFDGASLVEFDTIEQYGISYSETVNSMRSKLPTGIHVINDRAIDIQPGKKPAVSLHSGKVLKAKLVVIATGGDRQLNKSIGIHHAVHTDLASLSFGFYIKKSDSSGFNFNGFNYFLVDNLNKIDYLTIFPIGERMRVNLFTQLDPKAKLVQLLKKNTLGTLGDLFPDVFAYTGHIELDSQVQAISTTCYRLKNQYLPGLVLIGDAFQSVNPATGSGLSKVLTDVKILSKIHIPRWLNKEEVGGCDIRAFYMDKNKVVCDSNSLKSWYYSDFGPNRQTSLPKRLRRRLHYTLKFQAGN